MKKYERFDGIEPTKPERWMTLRAWNEEGMKVTKGSKSLLRSPDGLALFNEEQVEEVDDFLCDPSESDIY